MWSHRRAFTVSITGISRALLWRDRVLGRIRPGHWVDTDDAAVSKLEIASGGNVLEAVFARPAAGEARAAVLICHGIGETIEHWVPVQQLLAANGVASLVFDYSGYGRSTGRVDTSQCEADAIAAFDSMRELVPGLPIALLGFSLGSGIAAAIVCKVQPSKLVLCASFTSFRKAARSLGVPMRLVRGMPHVWRTEETLAECGVPVLIVHGEKDRLFPITMAEELRAQGGEDAELVVVPRLTHNEPFYRPQLSYWGLIVERLIAGKRPA